MSTRMYREFEDNLQYKEPEKYLRDVDDLILYDGKVWAVTERRRSDYKNGVHYVNSPICYYTIRHVNEKRKRIEEMTIRNDEIQNMELYSRRDVKRTVFLKESQDV